MITNPLKCVQTYTRTYVNEINYYCYLSALAKTNFLKRKCE